MSGKTKIVVLHRKEVIYTGIFILLGIFFIILLVTMFLPKDEETTTQQIEAATQYIPGIYTTELILGENSIDVEVIVDESSITSIRMNHLDEAITTMYPLLEPTFDTLCEQIYTLQSTEGVTYSTNAKYTSLVLLEAIQHSIDKAINEY